jgi:hypothetical protein
VGVLNPNVTARSAAGLLVVAKFSMDDSISRGMRGQPASQQQAYIVAEVAELYAAGALAVSEC